MIQIDTFMDKRIKILYALSFMHRGMAQVWATNETKVVLSSMSSIRTLDTLLENIENAFSDPDQERLAHMQLHALKMTVGITAKEYMAKFKMLAGSTWYNNAALEKAYIQGLHPRPPQLDPLEGLLSDHTAIQTE